MKRLLATGIAALPCLGLANCTGINQGVLYGGPNTNPAPDYASYYGLVFRGGFVFHNNSVPGPIGNATPLRLGESCSTAILGLFAFGDSSIETAKEEGDITKVASGEYEQLAVMTGLYHSVCTRVMGE